MVLIFISWYSHFFYFIPLRCIKHQGCVSLFHMIVDLHSYITFLLMLYQVRFLSILVEDIMISND